MGNYDLGNGRFKALLLAGPVFVTLAGLTSGPTDDRLGPLNGVGLFIGLAIMVIAVPFGALLSVLPVLLLTELTAFISYRNFGLRYPAIWGLAGGFVTAPWLAWSSMSRINEGLSVAVTGTGIICALLCRSSIVWHD